MTTDDIIALALRLQEAEPDWRWGQAVFNALHMLDPETAERIRATDADPYYDDSRLPLFWRGL